RVCAAVGACVGDVPAAAVAAAVALAARRAARERRLGGNQRDTEPGESEAPHTLQEGTPARRRWRQSSPTTEVLHPTPSLYPERPEPLVDSKTDSCSRKVSEPQRR